jgi:hypothetical protein
MLAKARIRANAQRSFVCVRKRPSAVNLSPAARDKQAAIVATAARAAPIARRQLRFPMPIVRILLVLLALASPLSMAGGAVAGPFEDAQAAHSRRDYATALRLWRPLAEQGNAEAQYDRVHDAAKVCRKITLGLQSGGASQPIKAIPSPSTTWGPCTTTAMGCLRTKLKH